MGKSGVLMHILAGSAPDVVTVLVHLEQMLGLTPDPIRRLAALGGQGDRLRLSNAQRKQMDAILVDRPMAEHAYRHGAGAATDRYLIEQATMCQPADAARIADIQIAAAHVFPLKSADLMPALQGAALGDALKQAETRWIASGFTLTKDDLIS